MMMALIEWYHGMVAGKASETIKMCMMRYLTRTRGREPADRIEYYARVQAKREKINAS